ncbi:trans-sulfuration enzyme family protein [Geomicrobium sediminis]|uniref:Methionine-gamma-lyase n=1 Tax=Geomicrobium sediminis TaxID=1347788 RepID=A0ABS2PHZ1_9BACL|nr:aminotransferase class I/II-fold pyridoxal phosphate-dependent enzyme [Geomicrobium sediminis]MBM7635048.1 methionine-gamma-lyase [Geomicrobium sediminis]
MNDRKETSYIHGGRDQNHDPFGSLTSPLYQTSTFSFDQAEIGEARFAGLDSGYVYTRMGNPTVTQFEERMAIAERAECALAFSSGMAAISAVLFTHVKSGEHILASDGIYGATYSLLKQMKERYKISFTYVDFNDLEHVETKLKKKTTLVLLETPINPTMKMSSITAVSAFAKKHDLLIAVDNTFATPYLQQPLTLGADLVIHSATKYIGGHGDVIAGVVAGSHELIKDVRSYAQKNIGAVLSPFDAWLLLRGMKTLAIRMDRHCANAKKIARRLAKHPKVKTVLFPGDPSFSDYELARTQMKDSGGMISFHIDGNKDDVFAFLNELTMIPLAVSLGDAETLISHPASTTHASIALKDRNRMGITNSLLRLSVGLEHYADIWKDLRQALQKLS